MMDTVHGEPGPRRGKVAMEISFDTQPDQYRHWRLEIAGRVAFYPNIVQIAEVSA